MRSLLTTSVLSLIFCAQSVAQEATPAPTGDTKKPAAEASAQEPKKLDEARYDHFGAGIAEGAATSLADAVKDPAKFTGKTVRLEGNITEICQVKGCWMTMGDAKSPVMVKFKDYGFFMPKDASGRTAIIEGTMAMKQETVEQTKHYLEDAGKTEEAAKVTEGRKILTFVASGVAIAKPAPKKLDEARYDHFGAGIVEGAATSMADAVKDPAKFTGKTVRLEGKIDEICQVKGCWMTMGDAKNPIMVKFKDYGFFMPKDASGRTAIIEGTMAMKQETVEQTKHYLEDAGKTEEAAKVTEGRKILTFVANGVAIRKPAQVEKAEK
jgi:hypothetical protein